MRAGAGLEVSSTWIRVRALSIQIATLRAGHVRVRLMVLNNLALRVSGARRKKYGLRSRPEAFCGQS